MENSIWNLKTIFSKIFANVGEFVLHCIHYLFSINESFFFISFGEQNFPAGEDLNNSEITNYVIFFSVCTFQMQKDSYQGKTKTKHFKLPLSSKCDGKVLWISLKIND